MRQQPKGITLTCICHFEFDKGNVQLCCSKDTLSLVAGTLLHVWMDTCVALGD